MPDSKRLFVALAAPRPLARALSAFQQGWEEARWVPPSNLHLTLAFPGDVEVDAVPELVQKLAGIEQAPFLIRLSAFRLMAHGRALALTARPSAEMERLHEAVQAALTESGMATEQREFHPHVTLARFRRMVARDRFAAYISSLSLKRLPRWQAQEFTLFESFLGPKGAAYVPLATFPLQ